MKTELDIHDELYLERLCDEDYLICWVRPMVLGPRHSKVPSPNEKRYRIEFRDSADYVVLQEITHAILGLDFIDGGHLSEIDSTKLLDFFSQTDIFPGQNVRNFVLRTAHCVV